MDRPAIVTHEIAPLPIRADDAHKGQVGRLIIIGGCDGDITMPGAPALTARAALRSGAGLVRAVVPESIRHAVAVLAPCATVQTLPADATGRELTAVCDAFNADAAAIGPGLGQSIRPETLRGFLSTFAKPVVIDADGLNLLSRCEPFDIPDPERVVLTPHPGEMKRLLTRRGVEPHRDRQRAALQLFQTYGTVAVLKGHGTVVTNGRRLYVNETGNPGMATAGTGDVLTGIITALIGQKMDPFEAAILGVFLHGLAGDFAAEEIGPLPTTAEDIIGFLPNAFAELDH